VLIRYGSTAKVRYNPKYTINTREAVKLASNKVLMAKKLLDELPELSPFTFNPSSYPIYGFEKYHSRGKGIVLLMSKEDREWAVRGEKQFAYYSKPLEVRQEYRVHVCGDETKLMIKKRPTLIDSTTFVTRNLESGYDFAAITNPSEFLKEEIIYIATKVTRLFGLDFCGVDMVLDSYKKPWILELNSAPGLSTNERTLEFYANNIIRMVSA